MDQIQSLLSWDQQTMMPPKSGKSRAEQISVLQRIIHGLKTEPRIQDWLADAEQLHTKSVRQVSNLREIRRQYERENKIPESLAAEISYKSSISQNVWSKARSTNNFSKFSPYLSELILLRKEEANCIKKNSQTKYEALMNDYEPEVSKNYVSELFKNLKPEIIRLLAKIESKQLNISPITRQFPRALQIKISNILAKTLGYNFGLGRIDESVHPFSSGNATDSRITMRIDEKNPFDCFFSTIHEVGHALYEQGIPEELVLEPAGIYASMGLHESQSRLLENQIGRSKEFSKFFFSLIKKELDSFELKNSQDLFRFVNLVKPGFIRVDADEIHYNLHIMLRFELEELLIDNDLHVKDLEYEWNMRFKKDFGLEICKPADGLLQDVHWSAGIFGYFPSYTLGNIFAACLYEKIRSSVPNYEKKISNGQISGVLSWLRSNIHFRARHLSTMEILTQATEKNISAKPLVDYLNSKYSEIYSL